MTEDKWLESAEPYPMLHHLGERGSDRKLRLFACACFRRIWHLLPDEGSRRLVEVGERLADDPGARPAPDAAAEAGTNFADVCCLLLGRGADAAVRANYTAARAVVAAAPRLEGGVWAAERRAQAGLLRDLFGNPFRRVALDPAWLRWCDGTVGKVARGVYEARSFADLPILADALEEAGCDREDILAHCRAGGGHARGCWVVDLLLEKE